MPILITFDAEKSAKNVEERGLSFELAEELDWDSALITQDTRRDYGEIRLQVLARLDDRLHAAVVVPRDGTIRVISFRKANRREIRRYDQYR